jgi:pimeloyl-ACP methyl ester carboxylesterase
VPHAQLLELSDCGHSPQRDQRDALIAAVNTFFRSHLR